MPVGAAGWPWLGLAFGVVWAVAGACLIVLFVVAAARERDVAGRWARTHGLASEGDGGRFADRYGDLNLVLRVTGGVAGWFLGSSFDDAVGVDTSGGTGFWAWVAVGWMIGAWWADRSAERPAGPVVAALVPRPPSTYLPTVLLRAPVRAAVLVAAIAAVGLLPGQTVPVRAMTGRSLVFTVVVAIGVAGLTSAAQRSVMARPQPIEDDARAVDDSARTLTVRDVGGAGTAAVLCIAAYVFDRVLGAWSTASPVFHGWFTLLPLVVTFAAWRYWSPRPGEMPRDEGVVT